MVVMKAITVAEKGAGVESMTLTDIDYPPALENDVVVRVHAAGFTRGELTWAGTWVDRAGRDRTPSVPGHEVAGVVAELGFGTTGLTVGQRVFGLTDWTRNGSLAEYVAVEARNLAPLPAERGLRHGCGTADLGPHGVAGSVRSRMPRDRADRPHPRGGRRRRLHRRAARSRGRRPDRRHRPRPGSRLRDRARSGRVRGSAVRPARGHRLGGRRLRRHRRRRLRAIPRRPACRRANSSP